MGLQTKIAEKINLIPQDGFKYGKDVAEQIIADMREVVEGAALKPEEIENITENIALSYIGAKAENAKAGDFENEVKKALIYHQLQAILKAIEDEEREPGGNLPDPPTER